MSGNIYLEEAGGRWEEGKRQKLESFHVTNPFLSIEKHGFSVSFTVLMIKYGMRGGEGKNVTAIV